MRTPTRVRNERANTFYVMKNAALENHILRRLRWDELDVTYLCRIVENAKAEDLAGLGLASPPKRVGDPSTELLLAPQKQGRAHLIARKECVVCGLPLVPFILEAYGGRVQLKEHCTDGQKLPAGTVLATLQGDAATILTAERVILNFSQKLTGIATQTKHYVACIENGPTRLLDTRKTTPGWRMLEKYAVATGSAWNHRLGLFDRIMLKDNHFEAGQAFVGEGLASLIRRARKARPDLPIECEVDSLEQIQPVLKAGADIILLDNFPLPKLRQALAQINNAAWTEASGGITLDALPAIAETGVDFISTGALTHQAHWLDIGLDWE
jgi:nicotinate-nucleotide pyrophosphorylase (carboxylating)